MGSAALPKQAPGTTERLVREGLSAQAAPGLCQIDNQTQEFSLSPEQAIMDLDEESEFFMQVFFDVATGLFHEVHKIVTAFRDEHGRDGVHVGTQWLAVLRHPRFPARL